MCDRRIVLYIAEAETDLQESMQWVSMHIIRNCKQTSIGTAFHPEGSAHGHVSFDFNNDLEGLMHAVVILKYNDIHHMSVDVLALIFVTC